ncbi:EAL domain-containing protein [Telmatospirillum sp.]|uniref:EAL domain-containing protein n=1 Tax=Telmatospirillum sp. TaxID=2079197 RepID=UPI00285095B0|nr:EAL domain-containing protein [Telmatospirillum sp.]MDR3438875.1 EAL domain-containing protein [Telmatospirillum sp.]
MLSIRVSAGNVLFKEGDPANCAYLVEEGWIEIYTEQDGRRQSLSLIGTGQLFGEMGVIDGSVRTATAVATENSKLLCISAEQFLSLLDHAEPFHAELLRKLVARFREAQKAWMKGAILPRQESSAMGPGYAMLAGHRDIAHAIDRGEIVPYLQPIVDMVSGRWLGFEALARWQTPDDGVKLPVEFLPLAERTGLVQRIDLCIALRAMTELHPVGGHPCPYLNINFSAWHFKEERLLPAVRDLLEQSHLEPERLRIELTESQMLDNSDQALEIMSELQALGVKLALDDFGTGYSSLSVLHQMPFQILKIDRSLVSGVLVESRQRYVLRNLVALAADLDMEIVTEGVEDEATAIALRSLGCLAGQGYLYGRPMPIEDAIAAWQEQEATAAAKP